MMDIRLHSWSSIMAKIFLLEDDLILGEAIRLQLELENYDVLWARSLAEAQIISLKEEAVDLCLLDVNLPDGSGFDFCRRLRQSGGEEPVIFLTARTDEESVLQGFDEGANDYIRKPFSNRELIARIRRHLGEKKTADDVIRFSGISLVKNKQILSDGERQVRLNRREFEIMQHLFKKPGDTVTRETLIEHLSSGGEIFDRTIDSHISHIRSKLRKNGVEKVHIISVYGMGYRLERKA